MTPIAGNRPDPRIRRPQLQQMLDLYRTVQQRGHGRVIFLAGDPGSGRSATLNALAQSLQEETRPRPHVIAASFQDGSYNPVGVSHSNLQEIVGFLGELLAVPAIFTDPLTGPLLGLMAQLLQLGAVSGDFVRSLARSDPFARTNPGLMLIRLLRQATTQQPVVCILDQIDRADPSFLTTFLIGAMGELLPGRRLCIVVSVDGPPSLPPAEANEAPAILAARSLMRRGLAEWLPFPPLGREEVAAWLRDAEPALVEHLHAITGGNPAWLAALWDDLWQAEKVQPHPQSYRWTPAPGYQLAALGTVNDILVQRLQRLLPDPSPAAVAAALELLAWAGLEGQIFTAQAVANALGRDPDDLIDFLDERLVRTDDQPYGLLEEWESVQIPVGAEVRHLWRYRFAAELFWYTLQQFHRDPSQQAQRCAQLAAALQAAYASQARTIAPILSRLHATAGNQTQAQHYRWMAHTTGQANAAYAQSQLLMQIDKSDWSPLEQGWVARQLNDVAGVIYHTHPFRETLEVAGAACRAAEMAKLIREQARALNLWGLACSRLGEMEKALGYYAEALPLCRQVGDRSGEASTLSNIGAVYTALGEKEKALGYCEEALPLFRQVGDRSGEAMTLSNIGAVYTALGEKEKALGYYEEALPLFRQVGDRSGEAMTLNNIGFVYSALGEMQKALGYYEEALPLTRQVGDRFGEIVTRFNMAMVFKELDRLAEAEE